MRKYIRIGVDIAKNCFQVHALESENCSATKRRLSRSGIVKFLAEVEPCAIGMEACGSAHYWARRFRAMGHEVKLSFVPTPRAPRSGSEGDGGSDMVSQLAQWARLLGLPPHIAQCRPGHRNKRGPQRRSSKQRVAGHQRSPGV